jgi:hypothetical protein
VQTLSDYIDQVNIFFPSDLVSERKLKITIGSPKISQYCQQFPYKVTYQIFSYKNDDLQNQRKIQYSNLIPEYQNEIRKESRRLKSITQSFIFETRALYRVFF